MCAAAEVNLVFTALLSGMTGGDACPAHSCLVLPNLPAEPHLRPLVAGALIVWWHWWGRGQHCAPGVQQVLVQDSRLAEGSA